LNVEEYFSMVINILMGLTLIAFVLIFFYMVYGKKEEESSSPSTRKLAVKISQISSGLCRLQALL